MTHCQHLTWTLEELHVWKLLVGVSSMEQGVDLHAVLSLHDAVGLSWGYLLINNLRCRCFIIHPAGFAVCLLWSVMSDISWLSSEKRKQMKALIV